MPTVNFGLPVSNESQLPPSSFREIVKLFRVPLHGWYAESAEGVLTRYDEDPADTTELANELEDGAAQDCLAQSS